ncbi:MAG: alpha/beta hydrolase [Halioglobus sp.]
MEKTITVGNTRVFIEGTGQATLVMLHGWPDTRELWRQQIDFFSPNYVCVSFTMPGFSKGDRSDYSVSDVVARIGEIVDAVSPDNKVILLVHDWGCVFGYEYAMRYSDRVEKMIGLDVGDADSPELRDSLSITGKLMVFTYQIILAISFVSPQAIGDAIARFMARVLQARSVQENIHAGMSMPYAMRWFGMNGGLTNLLPVDPPFPFYYGYATQKPVMFHSPQWLNQLLKNPLNKVQSYDCGHWIMVDRGDELNASVAQWLIDPQR